jgi:hypothetical protein
MKIARKGTGFVPALPRHFMFGSFYLLDWTGHDQLIARPGIEPKMSTRTLGARVADRALNFDVNLRATTDR